MRAAPQPATRLALASAQCMLYLIYAYQERRTKTSPFLSYTFVKATSMAASSRAMDSGVSSPMLDIRNVLPLIFP